MNRRDDKPELPGQQGPHILQRQGTEQTLHVFAPVDSESPVRKAVGQATTGLPSGEVVAGFAGQSTGTTRERCTLYLSPEVNAQLDLAAHIERKERSQVVEVILQQYLPKYRVERA